MPEMATLPDATRGILTLGNVTKPDGSPFAPAVRYREVKTADGRKVRVALIGLLGRSPFDTTADDDAAKTNPAWNVKDATQALKGVMPEAREKSDLVVVLFAAMRDEARRLAREVPGADVMIAGLEGGVMRDIEREGKTVLLQNSDRGRFASQLGITLDAQKRPTGFDLRVTPMDDTLPDDPEAMRLVRAFKERQALPVAPKPAAQPVALTRAGSVYAGSFTCGVCHSSEFRQWKGTKHAVAMQTLERKDDGLAARRPDCVSCHSVGYGKPDGYAIQNPRWDLRDVGCEACHGPGAAHVAARRAGATAKAADAAAILKPTKDTCTSCHNADNSPKFDYDAYLARVRHDAPVPARRS